VIDIQGSEKRRNISGEAYGFPHGALPKIRNKQYGETIGSTKTFVNEEEQSLERTFGRSVREQPKGVVAAAERNLR
jgi:hypothetical protein